MDGRQTCSDRAQHIRTHTDAGSLRPAAVVLCTAALLFSGCVAAAEELRPSLSIVAGGQSLVDDDMQRTYGTVPALGLRLTLPLSPRGEFLVGLTRAADGGDPLYDVSDFRGGGNAHLEFIPIEFILRTTTVPHPLRRFYLGVGLQYAWVGERIAGVLIASGAENAEFSGWGWGGRILGGPEWRFADGRAAAGLEFSWTLNRVFTSAGRSQRTVDLSGLGARLYLSTRL